METAWWHEDGGVHAAAQWLLEQWRQTELLAKLRGMAEPSPHPAEGRRWCVTPSGFTMVLIPGPQEYFMGSPAEEPRREKNEVHHRERIEHGFLIANTTATREQIDRFFRAYPDVAKAREERHAQLPAAIKRVGGQDRTPALSLTRDIAMLYCNWLSEAEGLEPCYLVEGKTAEPRPDFFQRSGYRLPTEAEWELACRARSSTARAYGYDPDLLEQYAWYRLNANDHTKPVGMLRPNAYGLFDMLGNVQQWCQDRYRISYEAMTAEALNPESRSNGVVLRGSSSRSMDHGVRSAYRQRRPGRGDFPDAFNSVRVVRTYRTP